MVFVRGGLFVNDICRVDLAGLGEELCFLGDLLELNFDNLRHLLEFLDVDLELPLVGRDRG